MLSSFILFLIVGGFTFNFYNSLSGTLKKVCLISTIILLVIFIVIVFMISKKIKISENNCKKKWLNFNYFFFAFKGKVLEKI